MRNELLMAATLAAIELNSGHVEAAPKVVTVSLAGPCTSNPVNFTDLHDAILSVKEDYSQLYDLQICPSPTAQVVGAITGTSMVLTSGTATLLQEVIGAGVPANDYVMAIGAAGTYTVSKPATVVAGTTLTLETPYTDAADVGFNGTIEGMGTTADSVLVARNCGGCQFYLALGDLAAPEPGVTLEVKNFHVEGTITSGSPAKASRLFQVIADGYIRFDNMDLTDGQDGILANRWANYAQAGYGVIVVSGSHFDNNGSSNGPSHNVYLTEGYDLFGGTITVPLGIIMPGVSLTPGSSILQNDTVIAPGSFVAVASITGEVMTVSSIVAGTIYPDLQLTGVAPATMIVSQKDGTPGGVGHYYVSNSQTVASGTTISSSWSTEIVRITAAGNTSGDVAYGYGSKFRPRVFADVENNNYNMNVNESSSGAIQSGQGATLIAVGNTITLGPQTGQPLGGVVNPPLAMAIGGLLGDNIPQVYIIANNTIVDSGSTKLIVVLESLTNTTDTVLTDNKWPLPAQMVSGIIQALGTVAQGNVYADSSPVTPFAQTNAFYIFPYDPTLDFRSSGSAQNITLNGTKQALGGSGPLTITGTPGQGQTYAMLGGSGGVNYSGPESIWYFTAPSSTNNVTITSAQAYNIFAYGNDTISFTGTNTSDSTVSTFAGANVHVNCAATSNCKIGLGIFEQGGTVTLNDLSTAGPILQVWPGAIANISGDFNEILANNGTISANIIATLSGTAVPFQFTETGGVVDIFPRGPIVGMLFSSFEDTPGTSPTLTMQGTIPAYYSIEAVGGGTYYAGDNKVAMTGNTRSLGPPSLPVTYHVQASAAGSGLNTGPGAFNVYLDGPGVVLAQRGSNQQQSDYLEIDPGGSGTVTLAQAWRPTLDKCGLGGGVTQTGSIVAGGTTTLSFSTGGKAVFQGTASGVVCNSVSINPSTLKFVQSTPLVAPVATNGVVGVISGGCPPYTVGDTAHFKVVGANLDAATTLSATIYSTTISDSLP